ncbi:MAG: hypothetical protein MZU95_16455 [Desulfomicrobium escambiense]|nr:hypothetical protein [Desulfomicrobium escambiense]
MLTADRVITTSPARAIHKHARFTVRTRRPVSSPPPRGASSSPAPGGVASQDTGDDA